MAVSMSQVEGVFATLLECEPDARDAKLAELCGDDRELLTEVGSLLAAEVKAKGFLSQAAIRLPCGESTDLQNLLGQRLGPYRLVSTLGRGGMGSVFLAERDDGQYRQQVAVKLACHEIEDPSLACRFHTERQVLAKLQHPNIARLLDGGTAPDGWPYLVMEYVQGEPIDSYSRAHRLPLAAMLRLFCKVCAAVQYSHQHFIVHRDLKPANILVTDDGEPKLLDFGIAKLLAPAPDSEGPATVAAPMTLEYAAPEQLNGGPITAATDVYALGVLLYELLSGQRPYDFTDANFTDVVRAICETEAPPPSRVAPPALRARLLGDVDNIVLRALRKFPQLRYPSVAQLADDVERYLTKRPVNATQGTLSYYCGKFLKRHALAVALAGLALAILLMGVAATLWQWRIAQDAHRRAEQRFSEVRELTSAIVFELPAVIEKMPASTVLRKRLFDRGLGYLDRLAQERRDDPKLLRELATAYYHLAAVQGNPLQPNLGDRAGALANYRKALALRERLLTLAPTDTIHALEVAESSMWLSGVYGFSGDLEQARNLVDRCVALLEPRLLKGDQPVLTRLTTCYTVAAHWDNASGNYRRARWQLRKALELLPRQRNIVVARRHLARIYEELAAIAAGANELEKAVRYERERLALVRAEPADGLPSRRLADAYQALASRSAAIGKTLDALKAYRTALDIWLTRAAADPKDPVPSQALAGIHAELGNLHAAMAEASKEADKRQQQHRLACASYRNSRAFLRRLPDPAAGFGARHPWLLSADKMLLRAAELCASAPTASSAKR